MSAMRMTKWFLGLIVISLCMVTPAFPQAEGNASVDQSGNQVRGSSATLEKVAVVRQADGVDIVITAQGGGRPNLMALQSPDRLVMDFPNTVSGYLANHIEVNSDGVKRVRIGVQDLKPPVTRVVVDLSAPQSYKILSSGNKTTLRMRRSASMIEAANETVTTQSLLPQSDPFPGAEERNSRATGSALAGGDRVTNAMDHAPSSAETPGKPTSANSSALPALPLSASGPSDEQDDPPSLEDKSIRASARPPALLSAMLPASAVAPPSSSSENADSKGMAPQPLGSQQGTGKASADERSGKQQQVATDSGASATDPPNTGKAGPPMSANNLVPDVPSGTSSTVAQAHSPADYVIGEQDVLTIVVWKERDLSGTVTVRPDGKITLPLVNEIKVVGMTPAHLQVLLTEKFKPFLTVPQITVEVNQINSRRVYLIGEVQKTGTYVLNSTTTVLQVIAEAGGFRDFAKPKDIYILRNQGGKQTRYPFNYPDVIRGKKAEQNIVLQPGDLIVVP